MQRQEVSGYLGRRVTATIAFGDGNYAIRDLRVTIRDVNESFVMLTVTAPESPGAKHEALWTEPHRIRLDKLLSLRPAP